MARVPTKLMGLIKKYGPLKGSGEFAAKQTGLKAMKTVVPLFLGLAAISAASPKTAALVSAPLATIPVVNGLSAAATGIGSSVRTRLGFNGA
jgi:hypothetical protein